MKKEILLLDIHKYSTIRYFEQYNDKFKKRLKRCRENERILELQKQYPKFNITNAFVYGLKK